jgi:hypothetical protein
MTSWSRVRSLLVGAIALTITSFALPASAMAATSSRVAQPKVFASPTLPLGSRLLGLTASTTRLSVGVFLEPRDPAALNAYAAAVSDVHSKMFRHYLARGTFASRFGPTTATVRAVESFLATRGLTATSLSSNHLDLTVTADVARLSSAFGTKLTNVRLPDGALGRTSTTVEIPASIASSVIGVFGLGDLARPQPESLHIGTPVRPTVRGKGHSFSVHSRGILGAPSSCADSSAVTQLGFGGITDDQVASAYGVDGLYSAGDLGAGQTVAIFEMEPFLVSDVQAFDECYFGADHTNQITVVPVDGGQPPGPGSGEAALDIESVSALAPAAHIDVYEAPENLYGWVDNYNQIVADDTARVISTSWGLCEQTFLDENPGQLAAENVIFEQAASQGQTVFAAAGDAGSDDCEYTPPEKPLVSVDDPASQPYVVGVGGTTAINVDQPPAEQAWNNGAGAGGGGISTLWDQPAWMPASADALSNAGSCSAPAGEVCRTVPDVSAFADQYTGITIYYAGSWYTIGGTSESAPLWAAMLAEVNASSTCAASSSTQDGVGFAAPLLYDVARNPTDYASGFTDVTVGNNDILNATGGKYTAGVGYDLATGLGSPELTPAPDVTGPGLAQSLCDAAQGTSSPTVTSIAPTSGTVAGGTPFTITGTGFVSGETPDVSAVSFGAGPAKSFTVVSNTEITGVTGPDSTTERSTLAKFMDHSGGAIVTVTSTAGSVAIGPLFHYDVVHSGHAVPEVFEVGPTGGPEKGGNTVRIYGSGFVGATAVTFGGVRAKSFTVVDDDLIDAVAPKITGVSCLKGDAKTLGLCQSEVRVTSHGGSSVEVAAKVPYSGEIDTNELGQELVPRGCLCEGYPTITEYDYVTTLKLTRLDADNGKAFEANPYGDGLNIDGEGFNVLTFNSVEIGPASQAASEFTEVFDVNPAGTQLQVFNEDPSPSPLGNTENVVVDTVGGASNGRNLSFGSIPQVNSLSTDVLPSAGGTTLTITGEGFDDVTEIAFSPSSDDAPEVNVLKNFDVVSSTEITLPSPSMDPGGYIVYVCNLYSCNTGAVNAVGQLVDATGCTVSVNYPGDPVVTSAEVNPGDLVPTGPTTGGTTFEVQGTDFGPLAGITIEFVNGDGEAVSTTAVSAGPAPTDPGATESILVTTPPSLGGYAETDYVVVSNSTGASPQTIAAYFEYQ